MTKQLMLGEILRTAEQLEGAVKAVTSKIILSYDECSFLEQRSTKDEEKHKENSSIEKKPLDGVNLPSRKCGGHLQMTR